MKMVSWRKLETKDEKRAMIYDGSTVSQSEYGQVDGADTDPVVYTSFIPRDHQSF